ncbi:hypothetical protein [Agaribacterium sp. ZY112]|uniref:hypothetical protein n=1 Tax=Agaribacterium sp. ZY112 TaxID=3233574 RepID=UPI0035238AA2
MSQHLDKKVFTRPLHFAGFVMSICLSCASHAFNINFSNPESQHYRNATELMPTHLMDDETLYLSAQAVRESTMSPAQIQAQRSWLCSYRAGRMDGMQAAREVLKLGLQNLVPKLYKRSPRTTEEQARIKTRPALLNLDNYALNLSSNKAVLKFSYHFD